MPAIQYELVEQPSFAGSTAGDSGRVGGDWPYAQQFDVWVHTPGGGHIAEKMYRRAAYYGRRFRRTGQQVSMKLIWELERDKIEATRRWLWERKQIRVVKEHGYTLNNIYTAYMARHIESRRPDWAGMFEKREVGREKKERTVVVKQGIVLQRAEGMEHRDQRKSA